MLVVAGITCNASSEIYMLLLLLLLAVV